MANPMDNFQFNAPSQTCSLAPGLPCDLGDLIQQARQNPQAFEDKIRQTNPEAYQRAMQIRNSGNPRQFVMQMLQSRGINPNVLKMLGLG